MHRLEVTVGMDVVTHSAILELERHKQEAYHEFEVSLSYRVRSYLKERKMWGKVATQ